MGKKPQEGKSVPAGMDEPHGKSRLRGAARSAAKAVCQSSIDAWLSARLRVLAWEARGRRPSATAEADKPWRGAFDSIAERDLATGREAPGVFLGVDSLDPRAVREGAALVAKTVLSAARVPRPSGANGGGSSGGPIARSRPLCFGARALSVAGLNQKNPKSGAEWGSSPAARKRADQSVRGVQTPEAQGIGDGCPVTSSIGDGRCAHRKPAEGDTRSMSGGGAADSRGTGERSRSRMQQRPPGVHVQTQQRRPLS